MRNGSCWPRGSRRAVRGTRRSLTTCAAPSRRSSGGTTMARSGARSRPSWARGGWRRRPSAAGRGWAPGSECWGWRNSVAGSRPGCVGGSASNPRRHQHPSAPQGRRRGEKGGTSAERDVREALGRSRGGFGTKACVIADASGHAIGFALAPGPAHELPLAPLLLTLLSLVPGWIVADRGYASQAFRDLIWSLGARPAIPSKSNEAPVHCPAWIYVNRNRVERLWSRLKEWRAVATRYEKTKASFLGVLCLAATADWLKT